MRLFILLILLIVSLTARSVLSSSSLSSSSPTKSSWVSFSNTSTSLTLTTPLYKLSLSSTSGTLLYLLDGISKSTLFFGSGYGQLWALVGPSGSVNNNALPFSWQWFEDNEGSGTLIMKWTRSGGGEIIQVNVSALANMRFFDITFELVSPPIGAAINYNSLWFPSMPLFNGSSSNVFFPLLPGVTLNTSFFETGTPINVPYPGSGVFAEFLHVTASQSSSVSIFTVSGPSYTIPHMKSLYPAPESGKGLWRYAHSIQPVNVTGSCDPINGGWTGGAKNTNATTSPCALGFLGTVLVRIAVNGSALDDLLLYGVSNGFLNNTIVGLPPSVAPYGTQLFTPIASKVKQNMSLLQSLARSTLVKVDAIGLGLNFSNYATDLLPILSPLGNGLLYHTCAWEPIAFDHYYPDLLPPNTRFGTGCDLADAHSAMASVGLVMPYSNPTWWDPSAPTLSNLTSPLTLRDVSSLNSTLQPIFETYPDKPPATGIVTELDHPFVTARIRALLCQLDDRLNWADCVTTSPDPDQEKEEVVFHYFHNSVCNESAVRLHSDIIFEDQLGARNAYADYHPRQGGLGALGYQNAIERHAINATSAWGLSGGILLGTEQGYDRLASSVIGFYGNAIELDANGYPFFSGNWTLTPLSSALFGNTVLYNVHNLATSAFALSLENACWALASGSRLSIDGVAAYWSVKAGNNLAWLSTVAAMQRIVASQWTGFSLSSFTDLYINGKPMTIGTGASKSVLSWSPSSLSTSPLFPNSSSSYTIVTNWANEDPVSISIDDSSSPVDDTFLLPPRSCLAYGAEQDVIGGWVNQWRGFNLQDGNNNNSFSFHFVIEDRTCSFMNQHGVCLHHGLGPDTQIYVLTLSTTKGESNLQSNEDLTCTAVAQNGTSIGSTPCVCNNTLGLVNVQWKGMFGESVVEFVFVPSGMC